MLDAITSVGELEACVGAPGLPVRMKIIDHLDAEAARWIGASPLAFLGVAGSEGPRVFAAGGPAGFAAARGDRTLVVPRAAMDDAVSVEVGQGAGALFLARSVGETLRANGRVAAVTDMAIEIAVEECFVHCAKALIRSDFWAAASSEAPADPAAFLTRTRFLALASMDGQGRIDISPKGDPAGLLIRLDGDRALLAERPGNRLAFGYRNIIEQPRVAALCVIPGATRALRLTGHASLTADTQTREAFVVEGKTPVLATLIDVTGIDMRDSPALAAAQPWADVPAATHIDAAATLVAHLKLNKARGAQATMLRLAANRGLVAHGLAANYKAELY